MTALRKNKNYKFQLLLLAAAELSRFLPKASLRQDLGLGRVRLQNLRAFTIVELVMAFEEEFGCEIPDDAAEKILTVKDAVNYIEQIT